MIINGITGGKTFIPQVAWPVPPPGVLHPPVVTKGEAEGSPVAAYEPVKQLSEPSEPIVRAPPPPREEGQPVPSRRGRNKEE
jgi:hypothetical protein